MPEGFEIGYYVKPTAFCVENNAALIAQKEVFGPVLTLIPYADENDAANGVDLIVEIRKKDQKCGSC